MVRMLAERYDMICCGENFHDAFPRKELSRWKQPGLCYFDTMSGWQEWLGMTPEQHWNWCRQVSDECVEIEILELIKLAASGKKIVVDTNIPPEILREISSYDRVAILLCDPPDICADRFFDRDDPEKQFMMAQIRQCPDPEAETSRHGRCIIPRQRPTGRIRGFSRTPAPTLRPTRGKRCSWFWQSTSAWKNDDLRNAVSSSRAAGNAARQTICHAGSKEVRNKTGPLLCLHCLKTEFLTPRKSPFCAGVFAVAK